MWETDIGRRIMNNVCFMCTTLNMTAPAPTSPDFLDAALWGGCPVPSWAHGRWSNGIRHAEYKLFYPHVERLVLQCYNIGLQLLEMSRATEAERFVGKALGLVRIGASKAFSARWAEAMHRVC